MHYSYSPTDSSRSLSSPESPSSSSTHYVWPVPASASSPSHHRRRTTAASPYYYYNAHNHSHTTSTTTTTSTSSVKSRRFYSSPLCEDSPDPKTPLQAYGLEQREPSIYELQLQQQQQQRPTPRLIRRMSTVLDDIKEDFHMQIDAHAAHDKQRLRRRESAFFEGPPVVRGSAGAGAGVGNSSPPLPPVSAVPPVEDTASAGVASRRRASAGGRPLSVLSWENTWSLSRRFSRRLSMLGSNFSLRRKRMEASISQPNLIGSSTQM